LRQEKNITKKFLQVDFGTGSLPDRFNNHFSLLNFNLNSETITRDILSVIDDRFNFYKKAQTLLDAVSKLVNLKTETGRKYAIAIKEFRKNYVYEVDARKRPIDYVEIDTTKYPVEELMFSLVKYYHQKREGHTLEDFKLIFQTEELYNEVISYFKSELRYFSEHKKESEKAFPLMDDLVKKAKQIQLEKLSS
jgi:hypothetical protein